jgi:hypothetical protein
MEGKHSSVSVSVGSVGSSNATPLLQPVAGSHGTGDSDLSLPSVSSSALPIPRTTIGGINSKATETTSLLSRRAEPVTFSEQLDDWRVRTYIFLNGSTLPSKIFQLSLVMLILLNISVFIVSTEPTLLAANKSLFDTIELVSVCLFTIEYSLRLWTITEAGMKGYQHPVWGRIRYALSITALIDFVSIFPYFLGLMISTKLPGLTWVRALRIFRILKARPHDCMHACSPVCRHGTDRLSPVLRWCRLRPIRMPFSR